MTETGDFELFTGPAVSEQKEMSQEQFREQQKKTQQALKQLQQEEGQAKTNDNNLAGIIVRFLSQPNNTDLFLLVSRAVAQNIPSELIIAVLSLVDDEADKEVAGYLEGAQVSEPSEALIKTRQDDFQSLDTRHKQAIDVWVKRLFQVGSKQPHRVLQSAIILQPERHVSPVLVQLSAFILRNYLSQNQLSFEFASIHDFMKGAWVEVMTQLEQQVADQKHLEKTSAD